MDGKPTVDHPCSTVDMGTTTSRKNIRQEQPGKRPVEKKKKKKKTPKTEAEYTDFKGDSSGEVELKQTVDNLNKSIEHDHDYIYGRLCCVCSGCVEKQKVIYKLQLELEGLKAENALLQRQAAKGKNVLEKFLKTDAKIRTYTIV